MINLMYGMSSFDNNKDKEKCLGKKINPLVTAQSRGEAAGLNQVDEVASCFYSTSGIVGYSILSHFINLYGAVE